MSRLGIIALILWNALPGVALLAQDSTQPDQEALARAYNLKADEVNLPGGDGAWGVRVVRTGGFGGRTVDVSTTSKGEVKCGLSFGACAGDISGSSLQAMNALVMSPAIAEIKSALSGGCSDCFITRITLRRRESDGKVRTYFAYWDDVTEPGAPPELVRIAREILSLQQ